MPAKEIALDLAAFLDSPEAGALAEPRRPDVRRVAEAFLAICYDELGRQPHLLDGEDVRVAVGRLLPARLRRRDPVAEHVPAVLRAYFDHLETRRVVGQAFEMRQGLEAALEELSEAVRSGRYVSQAPATPREPVVHHAPKLGRNEPCFCGSGKKFKKCHGRGT